MDVLSLSPAAPVAPATPVPQAPVSQTASPKAPSPLGRDTLQLSGRRPDLEQAVQAAEQITGKPVAFKSPAELDAYLKTVEAAKSESQYDREGFLNDVLGVSGVRTPGREDRATIMALRQIKSYRPDDKVLGSKLPQQFFYELAMSSPNLYLFMTKLTNPVLEAPAKIQGDWKKPFAPAQPVHPSDVKPAERYPEGYKLLLNPPRFADDFHFAPSPEDGTRPYGTYALAQALGFTAEQAKRIAENDNGTDHNKTPYGRTSPSPFDALDRHFNLDRDAQDTRLVWAGNHLQAAIDFARKGSFDEAEIELGVGLHSLQDLFAHGQLSPSVHATIGQFPDNVQLNPVAVYEATLVTQAYLRTYLREIATPAQ